MHVNPTRLAVMASACVACLAGGLLMGVATGGSRAAHLFQVETVTTTIRGQGQPAQTVTVTRSVTSSNTVTVSQTVTAAPRVIEVAAHHRRKASKTGPAKPANPPPSAPTAPQPKPKPAPHPPKPKPDPKPKPKPDPKPPRPKPAPKPPPQH